MAWVTSYSQDTDKPGVGTATSSDGVVTMSRRLDTNDGEDIQKFLSEALAKRAGHDKMTGESTAVIAKIDAVLNGA